VLTFIKAASRYGGLIPIGDPQRNYFSKGRFDVAAQYHVPVTRELEFAEINRTTAWRVPNAC